MDDAVKTTSEGQPDVSVSQTDPVSQDTQTTNETSENATEQTREVLNTPEAKEAPVEAVNDTNIQSPRAISRQQELANRVRELEIANQQLRQSTQYNPNTTDDNAIAQLRYKTDLLEAQMRIREEQAQFAEAENEFPELKSDKEFDNAVYDIYLARKSRGETIHPRDIAKQVKKLMGKAENAGMAKAENAIEAKSSAGVSVRRSDTNGSDTELDQEIREAKKIARTNGLEGAYRFLKATGM